MSAAVRGRRAARVVAPVLLWSALLVGALLLGRAARLGAAPISVAWPAAGVTTVWLLTVDARSRALTAGGIALLTVAVNLGTGVDLLASLVFGPVNAAHGLVAVWVLRKRGWPGAQPVRTLAHVTALLWASGAAALTSGVSLAVLSDLRLGVPFTTALPLLTVRNAVSTFVVTAALASLVCRERLAMDRGAAGRAERAGIAFFAVAAPLALLRAPDELQLMFLLTPLVVLVAVRLGPPSTACLVGVQGAVVCAATILGRGPFSGVTSPTARVLLAQALLAIIGLVGMCLAAAEWERDAARESAALSRDALQSASDAALVGQATLTVPPGAPARVTSVNPALAGLLQQQAHHVQGRCLSEVLDPSSHGIYHAALDDLVAQRITGWHGELLLRTGSGTTWVDSALALVPQDAAQPGVHRVMAQFLDIGARKHAEERLQHLALHDDLTGLANRALWHDRVQVALTQSARVGAAVGVLYVDLDHFKAINDTYGHALGDRVLVEVARRLQRTVRPQDTVARIGGDEFVVVCPELPDADGLAAVGQRLQAALSEDLTIDGLVLPGRASIGGAMSGPAVTEVRELLSNADSALHKVKTSGRGGLVVLRPEDDTLAGRRVRLLAELCRAVEHDELLLHYQPVVELPGGRTVGVEALLRWQHPERGLLAPADFLDVLEASPLIHEVGERLLRRAVTEISALSTQLSVNVNISAEELSRPGTAARVAALLEQTGMPPERLVIEVTETRLLSISGDLLTDLRALRRLGVRLAADDFGTGYSTLTHLVDLPVDVLKLDRRFVSAMTTDPRAHAVAAGVIAMARALGLRCVAEGVEEQDQADALAHLGCRWAQGYFWSRPLSLAQLTASVSRHPAPREPQGSGQEHRARPV